MNEVNERSHELDKAASEKSRTFIHQLLNDVNDRWKSLVSKTESKQMTLQVRPVDICLLLLKVDLVNF